MGCGGLSADSRVEPSNFACCSQRYWLRLTPTTSGVKDSTSSDQQRAARFGQARTARFDRRTSRLDYAGEAVKRWSTKDLQVLRPAAPGVPGDGLFTFTDRYSVYDFGVMPEEIPGKGTASCAMAVKS